MFFSMLDCLLALTFSLQKTTLNHLIDLIWEPLGGEVNLCPRVLDKGRERERWKDHSATVNNITVWIMGSLCARASTGLMTETCFRLVLIQTHTRMNMCAWNNTQREVLSVWIICCLWQTWLCSALGELIYRRKQRRQRASHTSSVTHSSFPLNYQVCVIHFLLLVSVFPEFIWEVCDSNLFQEWVSFSRITVYYI